MGVAEDLLGLVEPREAVIGIVGLGYVGLPLALLFEEKGYRVLHESEVCVRCRRVSDVRTVHGVNGTLTAQAANTQEDRRYEPDLHVRMVDTPHPPFRHEDRGARPSREHVWLKGHYDHDGTDWAWHGGRWEQRPVPNVRWVAPRYRQDHGKTRYEPEHWSHQHVIEIQ